MSDNQTPIKKEVTKEEFFLFLKNYPKKLISDVCGISDPPVLSYNDFSDNKVWPDSIVAFISLGRDLTGNDKDDTKFYKYFLKK